MTSCKVLPTSEPLTRKPRHLTLDPYNGFAYWTEEGEGEAVLRRIPWGCATGGGPQGTRIVEDVLRRKSLGPLWLDAPQGKILVPDPESNDLLRLSMVPKMIHLFGEITFPSWFP